MKKSENLNKKPHKTQKSDNLNKISKKIHKIHIPTGQLHHFTPVFTSFPLIFTIFYEFHSKYGPFCTYRIHFTPIFTFSQPFLKSTHYDNIHRPLTAQHTLMIPLSLAIFLSLKTHVKGLRLPIIP